MAWPTGAVSRANTDAGDDDPSLARSQIDEAIDKLNTMIAHTEPLRVSGGTVNGNLVVGAGGYAQAIVSIGGWAKGWEYLSNNGSTVLGGLGMRGTGDLPSHFALGFGSNWFDAPSARLDATGFGVGGTPVNKLDVYGAIARVARTGADVDLKLENVGVTAWSLANRSNSFVIEQDGTAKLRIVTGTGQVRLEDAAPSLIHRTGGQNVGEVSFGTSGAAVNRGTISLKTRRTDGSDEQSLLSVGGLSNGDTSTSIFGGSGSALCFIGLNSNGAGQAYYFVPSGARHLFVGGNIEPGADNSQSCGASGQRWSAVWAANGTIQTSDARDKTDVESIDPARAARFLSLLNPITFRWLVGGRKVEQVADGFDEREIEVEEEYEDIELQPATEQVEIVEQREVVELIDGRAVMRKVAEKRVESRPIGTWLEVVDESGHAVMMPTGEERDVGRGRNRTKIAVMAPKRHFVPVLEKVTVKRVRTVKRIELRPRFKDVVTDEAGRRFHAGLLANEVRNALREAGLDREGQALGLWVKEDYNDPNSKESLRPDQLLPIFAAAWKHQDDRLAAVEKALASVR
jgi:hypothetical protein